MLRNYPLTTTNSTPIRSLLAFAIVLTSTRYALLFQAPPPFLMFFLLQVLQEAFRVLKRGGRFMCLEFSQVWVPGLRRRVLRVILYQVHSSWIFSFSLYDWYSFQVIPVMGQVIASDWKSYQYLVESIRQFPNQVY